MSTAKQQEYRKDRIERLLQELQYEVTRGIMDDGLPERFTFNHVIPVSREIEGGEVQMVFTTFPTQRMYNSMREPNPRLRVVSTNPQQKENEDNG